MIRERPDDPDRPSPRPRPRRRRGPRCPACGGTDTVRIVYGMPSPEAFQAQERGEIHLGGCCLRGDGLDPNRHCRSCGTDFSAPPRR